MRFDTVTPQRGLLAGLLAFVAFASVAIAMTSGGSGTPTPAQSQSAAQTAGGTADGFVARREGRVRREGDGDGRRDGPGR
jgi:hypothetical protein